MIFFAQLGIYMPWILFYVFLFWLLIPFLCWIVDPFGNSYWNSICGGHLVGLGVFIGYLLVYFVYKYYLWSKVFLQIVSS